MALAKDAGPERAQENQPAGQAPKLSCAYCGSLFKTQRGATTHACGRMKLAEGVGGMQAARAYDLFAFWSVYNGFATKQKKFEQFTRSPYFRVFVDFVAYCERSGVTSSREYLRWLSDKRIPSKKWSVDSVLTHHRLELHRREDAISASTRCVDRIVIWCSQKGAAPSYFFDLATGSELVSWVKAGKMSPWVLLLSEHGERALGKLSEEQMHSLAGSLDVPYWIDVFVSKPVVVEEVKLVLDSVGLLFEEAAQ